MPTVALFHVSYSLFRAGPFAELLSAASISSVNGIRAQHGLGPVDGVADIHDSCALCLVAAPREFEPEILFPPNVRFVGPIPGPCPVLARMEEIAAGPQEIHSAANTQLARFVPHDRLLPYASLAVTHSGLGTTLAALRHGVPQLCVPMGRDQFFNAGRVQQLGAGHMIKPDRDPDEIGNAVRALLADGAMRHGAQHMAEVIARYQGARDATVALEHLAAGYVA